ncbi:GNAT family N-acetyltransferase [Halomonas cupida]|uniref:GNAT family N-acetyltransferase n=1 Tax=Halomonas cupida TaxID=44933 RepID=UPI0039B42ED0
MSITTSTPLPEHQTAWQRLYRGYAEYYQVPMTDDILTQVWQWIHDAQQPFFCRLALDNDGTPIGLAHFRAMPSPLRGTMVGFLDDLFVDPAHRGSGAVDALFSAIAEEGRRQGWPLIRWITRDNNYRGRAVYDRVATHTNWQTYQLDL